MSRRLWIGLILLNGLLAGFSVLAMPGDDSLGDDYYPPLGNTGYDVQQYAIDLEVDMAANTIDAVTEVTFVTTQDLSRFYLEFDTFDVTEVLLNADPVDYAYVEDNQIVINPAATLPAESENVLRLAYNGEPGRHWYAYDGGAFVFGSRSARRPGSRSTSIRWIKRRTASK
jgi:hypothetical protein